MKRHWRKIAAVAILTATIAVFIWYYLSHPEVGEQLGKTSWSVIASVLALYLCGVVAIAGVTLATVRLCKIRLGKEESLLLTAYSSVINFFGPLQSGPAFRAVYLKKKHNINLKLFGVASLVYYFFYGAFSGLLLVSGIFKWWLLALVPLGLLLMYGTLKSKKFGPRLRQLDLHGWYYLAAATALQIVIVTFIYFIELTSVAPGTSFSQAVIYTGAANLALFVSLTPGAIGFRESFLVFSQNLHHVSDTTIVAANILDRALYLVLLAILAVMIFGTHAKRRLAVSKD